MLLIYALINPLNNKIFYIGQSRRGIIRAREHWKAFRMREETNYVKKKLIQKILAAGKVPGIKILHQAKDIEELNKKEIELIAEHWESNPYITNIHPGGEVPSLDVCVRGGHATARLGYCAKNNLKLRKPIIATNLTTGEERWYLSASHAAKDGISSRSAIANCLRPGWRCTANRGWKFQYVNCRAQQ